MCVRFDVILAPSVYSYVSSIDIIRCKFSSSLSLSLSLSSSSCFSFLFSLFLLSLPLFSSFSPLSISLFLPLFFSLLLSQSLSLWISLSWHLLIQHLTIISLSYKRANLTSWIHTATSAETVQVQVKMKAIQLVRITNSFNGYFTLTKCSASSWFSLVVQQLWPVLKCLILSRYTTVCPLTLIHPLTTQLFVQVVYFFIESIWYRSYHIISCHIISYCIISYCIISYHITSYHITSYDIISHHITSHHIYKGKTKKRTVNN